MDGNTPSSLFTQTADLRTFESGILDLEVFVSLGSAIMARPLIPPLKTVPQWLGCREYECSHPRPEVSELQLRDAPPTAELTEGTEV
ncbi:hypothetical protein BJY01DRAFT_204565 [Aspergillus pseudoustus]|uniref:Uncharacterized protein n=1 Tax=Aspergillus pseudoustus TaxID=1810923 RepID=A0ABR4KRL5_9EURO